MVTKKLGKTWALAKNIFKFQIKYKSDLTKLTEIGHTYQVKLILAKTKVWD